MTSVSSMVALSSKYAYSFPMFCDKYIITSAFSSLIPGLLSICLLR